MLWILIAVLVVVAAWLYFKPAWAPKTDKVQAGVDKSVQFATDKAGKMYDGVAGRLKLGRDRKQLANKYRNWVAEKSLGKQTQMYDSLPEHANGLTTWLAGLSDKEMAAFSEKVARFAASLGFDLEWLVNDKVNDYPELKQTIEESVALYSIAAWRASNVQQEVRAFLAFQAWLANPAKNRALGQKLYSALVQQGLVMTSPDLYLATEKERMGEAVRAIKQAAEAKPEAVNAVLRGIMNPSENGNLKASPVHAAA